MVFRSYLHLSDMTAPRAPAQSEIDDVTSVTGKPRSRYLPPRQGVLELASGGGEASTEGVEMEGIRGATARPGTVEPRSSAQEDPR
jgi:hypothetical protein